MQDLIIYLSLAALLAVGLISFWVNPAYEKGVWFVMGAIGAALSGALGFKFGITQVKPDGGADQPK